jgi:predicted RNA methylase
MPTQTQSQSLTQTLAFHISQGTLTSQILGAVMNAQFGGTDAEGKWNWKLAYEFLEASLVVYLRSASNLNLSQLQQLQRQLPTHTRRSEEQLRYQQFSTPLPIGWLMAEAAAMISEDTVLEPSAGIGLLAIWAQRSGASLILNELADLRQKFLAKLFPDSPKFSFNAEHLHDLLPEEHQPTVVLMNPPFSASPNFSKREKLTTARHLESALLRLRPGGRLVALTSHSFTPTRWQETFEQWTQIASLRMGISLPGNAYYKHGTSFPTQLLVFDKEPGALDLSVCYEVEDLAVAEMLIETLPPRLTCSESTPVFEAPTPKVQTQAKDRFVPNGDFGTVVQLNYQRVDWDSSTEEFVEGLYEPYSLQSISIPEACSHPTQLVQSTAMASIAPPQPEYRPHLPERVIEEGQLSNAQLETLIMVGQAHQQILKGDYKINEHGALVRTTAVDPEAKQYRQGYFIADGTGCGKGRENFAIILDNWLQGRKRAIFVTASASLLEDARRDWSDLGGKPEQIISLNQFKQGEAINISEGIIFVTYATLRQPAKAGKCSRVQQLVNWVGQDWDGCLIFDESHGMANAVAKAEERGVHQASAQGKAGLEIQRALPSARVVYSSATGATEVSNLAYAERLGLWMGNADFTSRQTFMSAMNSGGIAAMEIVARDLKALGLYCSRTLSYAGVEYEILEHELTSVQVETYNAYAGAFQQILSNLELALRVSNAL